MPTRAELPSPNHLTYQETHSWTDDLPVCKQSGVGYSTNQIYREDGHRQEEHPFEDTSFHWCLDDNTYLYGVFDGHEGSQVATFALQRLAAEVCFQQLDGKTTDEEIKEVLRQAFVAVEKSYLETIGDKLAERTCLQDEIPDGLNSYEAYQNYPHLVDKLKRLNCELSCGTTAVIALIRNNRLYVANVGDSRALLCKTDQNDVLRVRQISSDHDLNNEDELLRLYNLGLDKVSQASHLGNQENTRCLGNYLVKGGYKEFEELCNATEEPVIAEPEITGGIPLDSSCRFLLLMSDGLYKSLEEATATSSDQVNIEIAQMTVKEFRNQTTLTGVAQAVVDKIVRIHHDMYMNGVGTDNENNRQDKRDDITLLVRNFNFTLTNALSGPTVRFNPTVNTIPEWSSSQTDGGSSEATGTTDTTSSASVYPPNKIGKPLHIQPYVDFSEFYHNVELARKEGTLPSEIDF